MAPAAPIRADLSHAQAVRRALRVRLAWTMAAFVGLGLLFCAVWGWRLVFDGLPRIPRDTAALWSLNRPPGITFQDRVGQVIAIRGSRHGEELKLSELPPYVPRAFLAAEDRRFWSHPGVDLLGVGRALLADARARGTVQGASTIDQQLVRTLWLGPEQTLHRKAQEAVLALMLEQRLSKAAILSLYLNRVYFGGGAYGVEAASQTYFGKSARQLTLAEAAVLASLPKAPTRLDPTNDYTRALKRSRRVLKAMRDLGWISAPAYAQALAQPVVLASGRPGEGAFGYALDLAAEQARQLAGRQAPDLIVRTSLDSRLQNLAGEAVAEGVRAAGPGGASQGALVLLSADGGVRALVGGIDHRMSAFDRAVQARRQPGSAFKPFVYAAALEAGLKPGDVREDKPLTLGAWSPTNASGGYVGRVTLAEALARSINTVAIRVAGEVGPERVAALARRFGLESLPPRPGLTLALGAYEVTPLDLAVAYQSIQTGGLRVQPRLIEAVANARGDVLWQAPRPAPRRVFDPELDAQLIAMLQGVIQHGTGRKADIGRPAAGKTGTTTDNRDAWFAGFTPDFTCVVWMGDDRGRPMQGVQGGEAPALVWRRVMLAASEGLAPRAFVSAPEPDARPAFYRDLAQALERQAAEAPSR